MSDPDKPISEKQRAANRANAQHSTGPRTPEGKARSARNARKHGFTASTFSIVRLEEIDEVDRLKEDLRAVYHPVNAQELFAVERIALAQQGLLRAARLEAGMFTVALDETVCADGQQTVLIDVELTHDIEVTRQQNRNYAIAEGFQRMAKKSNSWALFLRYQVQAERMYRRAVEEFERLKKLRPELPNEPISEPEPQLPEEFIESSSNPLSRGAESPPPSAPDPLRTAPAVRRPHSTKPSSVLGSAPRTPSLPPLVLRLRQPRDTVFRESHHALSYENQHSPSLRSRPAVRFAARLLHSGDRCHDPEARSGRLADVAANAR